MPTEQICAHRRNRFQISVRSEMSPNIEAIRRARQVVCPWTSAGTSGDSRNARVFDIAYTSAASPT